MVHCTYNASFQYFGKITLNLIIIFILFKNINTIAYSIPFKKYFKTNFFQPIGYTYRKYLIRLHASTTVNKHNDVIYIEISICLSIPPYITLEGLLHICIALYSKYTLVYVRMKSTFIFNNGILNHTSAEKTSEDE